MRVVDSKPIPARFQVQGDGTIRGLDGRRFVAKGVSFPDFLLTSFEYREDWRFRQLKGLASNEDGWSEGTGYAKVMWRSRDDVERQMDIWQEGGVNTIRCGLEPATAYTPAQIDPADRNIWPAEYDMVDQLVDICTRRDVALLLRQGNDQLDVEMNSAFMASLGERYRSEPYVWLNPANEINCAPVRHPDGTRTPNPACQDPWTWHQEMGQYVEAIRSSGFLGPIVINPTRWGGDPDAVESHLTTSPVLAQDPNLVIGVHIYPGPTERNFVSERQAVVEQKWRNGLSGNYCCLVEEIGFSSSGVRYDPDLDPGVPSANLDRWTELQVWLEEFFSWAADRCVTTSLSGVIATSGGAYIPGVKRHDPNSVRRIGGPYHPGDWTTYGRILRDRFLLADMTASNQDH